MRDANDEANKQVDKANNQFRFASRLVVFSLVVAMCAAIWTAKKITESNTTVRLEREGVKAVRLFESKEIEPLLLAIQAGQELKELVNHSRPLEVEEYPTDSPQLALQTILDNIHQKNQFKGHTSEVTSASFSPDGQHIVTASWDNTARAVSYTHLTLPTIYSV